MADVLSAEINVKFPETSMGTVDAGRFMALVADKIKAGISEVAQDFGLKESEVDMTLSVSPTVVVQEDFQSICKSYLEKKTLMCSYGETPQP